MSCPPADEDILPKDSESLTHLTIHTHPYQMCVWHDSLETVAGWCPTSSCCLVPDRTVLEPTLVAFICQLYSSEYEGLKVFTKNCWVTNPELTMNYSEMSINSNSIQGRASRFFFLPANFNVYFLPTLVVPMMQQELSSKQLRELMSLVLGTYKTPFPNPVGT